MRERQQEGTGTPDGEGGRGGMDKAGAAERVDYGYLQVSPAEKRRRVGQVFASVAPRYDLMNDLMSFGLHRAWKRFAVAIAALRPGERVLDAAGGTGDLSRLCLPRVGERGQVVLLDASDAMLRKARERCLDRGIVEGIRYVRGDAERPPFREQSFDCILIAFGMRNLANREAGLRNMRQALRRGGRLIALEFSRPATATLRRLHRHYCLRFLPFLGEKVLGDAASYRYLAESVLVYPEQRRIARDMREAGYREVEYYNLCGGIVAAHRGYRI